jgi:hypothetical protein
MVLQKYALLGLVLAGGFASASVSGSSLSDKELAGIHRVAIIVSLGNTFRGNFRHGVTAFGSRRFDVSVPQWQVDRSETEHIASTLNAGGKFTAEALIVDDLDIPSFRNSPDDVEFSSAEKAAILERARQQGMDAIVIATPSRGEHGELSSPGFGILGAEVSGKRQVCVFAYIAVRVIRTGDGDTLAQRFAEPCRMEPDLFEMKETWEQYPPDQQLALQTAVNKTITAQIDGLLAQLRLTD